MENQRISGCAEKIKEIINFQKPRCQRIETNLSRMAGSRAPPVHYTVRRRGAETKPGPDEREKGT